MSYYHPQFPALYAAYPVPVPNQEYYAMYPSGPPPHDGHGPIFYDHPNSHHHHGNNKHGSSFPPSASKPGFNNRKESTDSGISDYSVLSAGSRKTSSISVTSNASISEEASTLDEVKEEAPYEVPDDDLCEKIATQVEFYFSDANITKDKFLLKHVKRNKEGFVSLKLISSFKRVKHLTKDWRQVAAAIERKSERLEVNDLKTKVRRLDQLPEYDETTPSRTVVALNLPLERPTIEGVAEIFSACGDIVLIRILRPGNPIPADIKPFANKHPEMTAKVCALVEFERTEFALKAVRELTNTDEATKEEDRMVVMELTAPPPKSTKKEEKKKALLKQQESGSAPSGPQRRFSHAGFNMPPQHSQQDPSMALGPRRRISLFHNMKFSPIAEEHKKQQQQMQDQFALNPNAPTFQMQQAQQQQFGGHHHAPPHGGRRYSRPPFHMHPAQAAAMEAAHAANMGMMSMPPQPWMTRRMSAAAMGGGPFEMASSGLTLPPNVVRMPRGPDKGKGFQKWCKSRMTTDSNNNTGATPNLEKKKKSHAVPIVAPPKEEKEEEKKKDEEEAVADPIPAAAPAPAAPAAPAAEEPAAEPAVEGAVGGAAAVAVATPDSADSGNEDDSFSEEDSERAR